MNKSVLSTLSFAVLFPTLAFAKGIKCDYALLDAPATVLERLIGKSDQQKALLYPIGVSKTQGKHVMFGFESEYTVETSLALLKVYKPRPEFGISETQWLNRTDAERVQWVREQFARQEMFSKDAGLELIRPIQGMEYMPKELIKDDSGSLEIVLQPVNELATFVGQVRDINKRFGAGSMQAMVSSPKESFFYSEKGKASEAKLGFFTLMAEADALQKLRKGADRFEADPTKQVARSFVHPFLAPMTAHRQTWLKTYLEANSKGELFDKESLKKVVYSEDSFKYTGTSAYRPDIGGKERVSIEVRDAHVDQIQLLEKVERLVAIYTRGTDRFIPFAKLKSLQTDVEFSMMPQLVQRTLREIFPAKIEVSENFTANEVFSQEVFRNFAYPMRDWKPFLELMGKERFLPEVKQAQNYYVATLHVISANYDVGRINKETASTEIQGALAKFVKDSSLNEHFEAYIYNQL